MRDEADIAFNGIEIGFDPSWIQISQFHFGLLQRCSGTRNVEALAHNYALLILHDKQRGGY
jgi:hypothetical protein